MRDIWVSVVQSRSVLIGPPANETRNAGDVRDWLEANGGRAVERRLLTDPAGHSSLLAA